MKYTHRSDECIRCATLVSSGVLGDEEEHEAEHDEEEDADQEAHDEGVHQEQGVLDQVEDHGELLPHGADEATDVDEGSGEGGEH